MMNKTQSIDNNTPLVTVITPVYNRDDLVEETIESILSQDYPNIEYIVLDDGSKDKSWEKICKFKDRIICERHANMGEPKTVNKGFAMAKGEIIAIVNSDDPLYPGAISKAVKFMNERPDILVAYPDWDYINEKSVVFQHVDVPEYDYLYMITYHKCIVGPGAFIRKKSLEYVKGRDASFKYVSDFDFWLRLGLYGPFARIPETLATFRVHSNSLSVSEKNEKMASEDLKLLDKIFAFPNLPENVKLHKKEAYSYGCYHAALICGNNKIPALKYYLKSFLYYPKAFTGKNKYKIVDALSLILPNFLIRIIRFICA